MIRNALLLILFFTIPGSAFADSALLTADTAYQRARSGHITLLDIRSPGEWRQTGMPAGAVALTMHNPDGADAFYKDVLEAVGRDKSRPIAVICAAGNRSRWAQAFLTSKGFTNIQDVGEGLFGNGALPGWLKRGLPVRQQVGR
ncbi:MAG: rhodanese-like domain-containing protein [Alphaproteobacteria bacterium]|nr:rhodanese-like domain-containing protein [Alphaproteobacteria bacterium]